MADTLDVLTLDEGKAAVLNNAGTSNDTALKGYITGVSRFLDQLCGPIVQRTITNEAYSRDSRRGPLLLKSWPVVSITSVTQWAGATSTVLTAETPGSIPDAGYLADLSTGQIFPRSAGHDALWPVGRSNIVVTYVAGRYADTASVDQRFKMAAGIILANFWRSEHGLAQGTGYDAPMGATFGLPHAAKALLENDIQARVA